MKLLEGRRFTMDLSLCLTREELQGQNVLAKPATEGPSEVFPVATEIGVGPAREHMEPRRAP